MDAGVFPCFVETRASTTCLGWSQNSARSESSREDRGRPRRPSFVAIEIPFPERCVPGEPDRVLPIITVMTGWSLPASLNHPHHHPPTSSDGEEAIGDALSQPSGTRPLPDRGQRPLRRTRTIGVAGTDDAPFRPTFVRCGSPSVDSSGLSLPPLPSAVASASPVRHDLPGRISRSPYRGRGLRTGKT